MHGFLNIDKPMGCTSHDVVARVRRIARQKRVGHAGTLDPAATGVLVLALGAATRLIEYVQETTVKRYQAVVHLGVTTTTDDAEGQPLSCSSVPLLTPTLLEDALAQLRGPIMLVPPMYAALHHEGQRLHTLARAGIVVERAPRPVTISRLVCSDWSSPLLTLDVVCSKGTYIRALARDLGVLIGCGAHLQSLRRVAVGDFLIGESVPLAVLEQDPTLLTAWLLPPESAVIGWFAIQLAADEERRVRNGLSIMLPQVSGMRVRAHGVDGSLCALLVRDGDGWQPEKVFDWTV